MRATFDQFAKQLLGATLTHVGIVESEREVSPDAQRVDVWFVPDSLREQERVQLGLLGRMAEEACLFEAFHEPPDASELRACLRKHFAFHSQHLAVGGVALPRLWIVSAGRARAAMTGFGLRPAAGWPTGVYRAPPDLGLWMAVVPELPVAADTLLVRLLGAGRVLAQALAELTHLPVDSLTRRQVTPLVLRLRLMKAQDPASHEREEFMQATEDLFQEFERQLTEKATAQGLTQGIAQGQQRALLQLVQLRLTRPMTATETATVADRGQRHGVERIQAVVLASTAAELADWLAAPDTI